MSNGAPHILVADDNAILADVLQFNLQRAGFEVTVAQNGDEALYCLQNSEFDLLLTDIEMPGRSGEQLCQAVREELQLPQLPIVVCSAKGLELDAERLRSRFGVAAIVFKPFSVREIISRVRSLTTLEAEKS